jgi:hypothetical protein
MVNRPLRLAVATVAVLFLCVPRVQAGPCGADIKRFEQEIRRSAKSPGAGPMARQTIGAQLGHQPTRASVRIAEKRAQAAFTEALMRAKRYNAQGDRGCRQALTYAERLYNP